MFVTPQDGSSVETGRKHWCSNRGLNTLYNCVARWIIQTNTFCYSHSGLLCSSTTSWATPVKFYLEEITGIILLPIQKSSAITFYHLCQVTWYRCWWYICMECCTGSAAKPSRSSDSAHSSEVYDISRFQKVMTKTQMADLSLPSPPFLQAIDRSGYVKLIPLQLAL